MSDSNNSRKQKADEVFEQLTQTAQGAALTNNGQLGLDVCRALAKLSTGAPAEADDDPLDKLIRSAQEAAQTKNVQLALYVCRAVAKLGDGALADK